MHLVIAKHVLWKRMRIDMKNAEFYVLKPYLDRGNVGNVGILVIKNTEFVSDGIQTWRAIMFWSLGTDPLFDEEVNVPLGKSVDYVAQCALDFLTLSSGDTDSDYFDDYTPEQLTWRDEHAEAVGALTGEIAKYRVV